MWKKTVITDKMEFQNKREMVQEDAGGVLTPPRLDRRKKMGEGLIKRAHKKRAGKGGEAWLKKVHS